METKSQTIKNKLGFTLIEFIIVMTIGAILSGMIIPVGQKLVAKARTIKDISNVKQLALAYHIAFYEGLFHTPEAQATRNRYNIFYMAGLLACKGLNNTKFYLSCFSPENNQQIVDNSDNPLETLTEIDWEFALNIPMDANPSTTPIIVSRGLLEDGSWRNKPGSVYGKEGGVIAFLDGHVVWCKNCSEVLISRETGLPTTDYNLALPAGAQWCNIFTSLNVPMISNHSAENPHHTSSSPFTIPFPPSTNNDKVSHVF